MARFDKVDPTVGMHRAALNANVAEADFDKVLACGLTAAGKLVVKAAGNSGFVGVTIVDRTKRRAGQINDIMSIGEIVECDGLVAGTKYYVQPDGTIGTSKEVAGAPATPNPYVGYTIEADRLVVQFEGGAN